jgi:hypothetical protein
MLIQQRIIKTISIILLLVVTIISAGCKRKGIVSHNGAKDLISFKSIQGITYTEVARRMKNGLSFNEYGYQLEPQWKMSFISDDSTRIYSPIKKQLINFPLSRGYDSIFNTARSWLKVRKMNKDSLVIEILKYKDGLIDVTGAQVYMIFYADNYIKIILHSDSTILRKPSRRDTLYISKLVAKANTNYKNAFSARQPVQLISKTPMIKVEQRKTEPSIENNFDTSDDYLDPTYDIVINKAYRDFYYSFSMYVDDKGNMIYERPLVPFTGDGFKTAYIKESQDIMNTYFKLFFKIIPGSTLGMPHTSIISIHVRGVTTAPKAAKNTIATRNH